MIIDSNALKLAAQNIIDRVDRRAADDRTAKINVIKTCGAKILASIDAAAAIAPAVAALHKRHLKFVGQYYTNGWDHRIGFCKFNDNLVGCEGGGCSGLSLFVDVVEKTFYVGDIDGYRPWDEFKSIDELAEKYWDNWNVRGKFEKIANELVAFAEQAANDIQSRA